MIRLQNLTYRYRDDAPLALSNVSVEIKAGEAVSVMGANGSGKSTFAKILAGLISATQGRADISPATISPIPVGIIFQNPDNQMVAVTVEKELAFALENLGYSQDKMDGMLSQVLDRFGIAHLRSRLTTELSGGEKQRVALASVMIFQPDILVLDEPDSFLDELGKAALWRELASIKTDRPSMIQVHITQYPEVARRYDRLLVFDRGELAADGSPEQVFADVDFCEKSGLTYDPAPDRRLVVPFNSDRSKQSKHSGLQTIHLESAGFRFGDDGYVFRNLSTDLKAGEITGVVGLSGSGKSTLGNLICGILPPSSGRVVYVDRASEVVDITNLAGLVSGVFQQPERQFFLPTCREELLFGPKNLGFAVDSDRLEALFAMVGLEADEFSQRDPFTLSGGEKRRLAFAAVLAMSPDFVVFDEPTCGLDPEGVGRFIVMARTLKSLGVGLMVISHDGQVINSLADNIILLRTDGSNLVLPPDEFFAEPNYYQVISPVSNGVGKAQ